MTNESKRHRISDKRREYKIRTEGTEEKRSAEKII